MLHRRRDAGEIAHRPQAHVQVEHLSQRNIERANASPHGRCQRPLDADQERAKGFDRVIREPVVKLVLGFVAGEDLHPGDLALALIRLLN
jgi:hypothetical protein